MNMRSRSLVALAAALLAAAVLAACGRSGASNGPGGVDPDLTTLRVLDPGGRLFWHAQGPYVRATSPGGAPVSLNQAAFATGLAVFDATNLPLGSELVVAAPGCRVERRSLDSRGDVIVRLRRGPRITLRVRWDGRLPPGVTSFTVALEADRRDRDAAHPERDHLRSVGADWMERDRPESLAGTPISGADAEVVLYVSEPGAYVVDWSIDAPNSRSGFSSDERIVVPEGGLSTAVDVTPPAAWLANATGRKAPGGSR